MDKIQQIRNNYIDLDKNVFTKYINIYPSTTLGSNVYGKIIRWNIPTEHNNLSQLYIKATVTLTGNGTEPQTGLGTRIAKLITLKQKSNQTIIAEVNPQYSMNRLDELDGTRLYEQLSRSVESTTDLSVIGVNTGEVIIPIPAWFCHKGNELQTRYLGELELELISNDNKESMGLPVDVTSIDYELIIKYYENTFYESCDFPKDIYGYAMYQNTKSVPSGSTSANILINCPFPVFASHFLCYSEDQDLYDISRVVLKSSNVTLNDIDKRAMYNYDNDYDANISIGGTGSLPMYFNQKPDRKVMENNSYISFSQALYPCIATVYFRSALASDATLSVVSEYKKKFEISREGFITTPLMGTFDATGKHGI